MWKGRLGFKQYIPLKRARFGVKAFMLCEDSGYTFSFKIYPGKENIALRAQELSHVRELSLTSCNHCFRKDIICTLKTGIQAITAMIYHIFISLSAVQIYELSYIDLRSSPSTGILRTHKVASSQWLDSSAGRALHRYRRGHGLESRSGLDFFQALIS